MGRRLLALLGAIAMTQVAIGADAASFPTSTPVVSAAETARRAGVWTPRPPTAELKAIWEGPGTWSQDIGHDGGFMSGYAEGEYADLTKSPPNIVPLKPGPMAVYMNIRRENGRGRQIFGPYTLCHPAGMPYLLTFDFSGGYEVVVADDEIDFFYGADREQRRIYLDGRAHPDEQIVRLYNGFSVAHWEGDTMVVETTNIRGSNTQIEPHVPKAEGSYIIERYTPKSPGRFDLEMTMMNPDFTRPCTGRDRQVISAVIAFSNWLATTEPSLAIQNTDWIVPAVDKACTLAPLLGVALAVTAGALLRAPRGPTSRLLSSGVVLCGRYRGFI